MLNTFRAFLVSVAAAVVLLQPGVQAQNLAFSLFERYLESLRVGTAIPGLSVVVVQNRQVVWERGLGHRDVEGLHLAQPDTPYPLADLTATITAALLGRCAEQGSLDLDTPIGTWVPTAENPGTTLRQMVRHAAPGNVSGFKYDPARFALLAKPIEACMEAPFRKVLADRIIDALAMRDAVPGYDIATVPAELRQWFDDGKLAHYASVLSRMATPYKIDRRGKASRSELPPAAVDASHGLIASARDLAEFDKALDSYLIIRNPAILAEAWTTTLHNGIATPFGMGWFVQYYQGEKLVWQHGYAPDAFSSLILKVPGRHLTLILLANSDGLSAPFSLSDGDVTSSVFARTFLRFFL